MPDSSSARKRRDELHNLLLVYLIHGLHWPGSDSLTVEEALRGYGAAMRARRVPGQQELLLHHPEWAEELAAFFVALDESPADRESVVLHP